MKTAARNCLTTNALSYQNATTGKNATVPAIAWRHPLAKRDRKFVVPAKTLGAVLRITNVAIPSDSVAVVIKQNAVTE